MAEKDGFDIGGRTLSDVCCWRVPASVSWERPAGGGTITGSRATLQNRAWCNPALGYFPNGGHFETRNGGSHRSDVTNSSGTAVYAAAAGTVIRRQWGGGLPYRTGNGIVISHGGGLYTYGHLRLPGLTQRQGLGGAAHRRHGHDWQRHRAICISRPTAAVWARWSTR